MVLAVQDVANVNCHDSALCKRAQSGEYRPALLHATNSRCLGLHILAESVEQQSCATHAATRCRSSVRKFANQGRPSHHSGANLQTNAHTSSYKLRAAARATAVANVELGMSEMSTEAQ
jgi:hypothetical protein